MNNSKLIAIVTLVSGLIAMGCAVSLTQHHPRKLGQSEEVVPTVSRVHGVTLVTFSNARGVTHHSNTKNVSMSTKTRQQHCFSTELEQGGPGSVVRCEWL